MPRIWLIGELVDWLIGIFTTDGTDFLLSLVVHLVAVAKGVKKFVISRFWLPSTYGFD